MRPAPPSPRPDSHPAGWWKPTSTPAQGFVAAGLGLALIPALALGVRHDGVAVRRLEHTDQPARQVLAATRPAVSGTAPVQAIIAALQAEAGAQHYDDVTAEVTW